MKISLYGSFFTSHLIHHFKKKEHHVLFNKFSPNIDVIIAQSIKYMYPIYRLLKKIKENNIKLINVIPDIPPWRLQKNDTNNSKVKNFRQNIFHFTHKNQYVFNIKNKLTNNYQKREILRKISKLNKKLFDSYFPNKTLYLKNYRNFLKKSDLILSYSKFTKKLVKTYLKLESNVWYPCADSDLIERLPKNLEKKFDAINISRIVPNKDQIIFVKAAKRFSLNIVVIGPHQDKSIKLECPHYILSHEEALKALSQSDLYVDPSRFEGFGMTPVEAAFLNKPTIASDICVHKEVLGNYPLYFKTGSVKDLTDKIKMVKNGEFLLNKDSIEKIKKKYSIAASATKLLEYIESIL